MGEGTMSVAPGPRADGQQDDEEGAPAWSGIPVIAGDQMVLPLHVTDTRHITFGPEWAHMDHWPSEGGDVEYHVYVRRTT